MALIGSSLCRVLLVVGCGSVAGFGQAAPKPVAPPSGSPPPVKRVRVIADLGQFHLDQATSSAKSAANQISAGTRGGDHALVLCAPGLGVTSTPHPTFEWRDGSGAGQLTFTLMNASGDVVYEGAVSGSSWKYPETAAALEPGQVYAWKVSGSGMDDVPPPARVEVESASAQQQVSQQVEAGGADPLVRAQVYLKAGLWYDTVSALEAGMVQYPNRRDLEEQLRVLYLKVAPGCEDR